MHDMKLFLPEKSPLSDRRNSFYQVRYIMFPQSIRINRMQEAYERMRKNIRRERRLFAEACHATGLSQ